MNSNIFEYDYKDFLEDFINNEDILDYWALMNKNVIYSRDDIIKTIRTRDYLLELSRISFPKSIHAKKIKKKKKSLGLKYVGYESNKNFLGVEIKLLREKYWQKFPNVLCSKTYPYVLKIGYKRNLNIGELKFEIRDHNGQEVALKNEKAINAKKIKSICYIKTILDVYKIKLNVRTFIDTSKLPVKLYITGVNDNILFTSPEFHTRSRMDLVKKCKTQK